MMTKYTTSIFHTTMKASLIIFFLHSGHIVLLSAHVQNSTNRFIFPVSFYFDGYFNG